MPNPTYPLTALQNATSIGNPWDKIEVKQGIMPGPPALKGLASALPAMKRILPAAETLGEVDPYFTPQGGEAMYNLGKIGNIPDGWKLLTQYFGGIK